MEKLCLKKCVFSHSGDMIAFGGLEKILHICSSDGVKIEDIYLDFEIYDICFSKTKIVACGENSLIIYNLNDKNKITMTKNFISSVSISHDEMNIAFCFDEENSNFVSICNIEKLKEIKKIKTESFTSVVKFFPNKKKIVFGGEEKILRIYDYEINEVSEIDIEGSIVDISFFNEKIVVACDINKLLIIDPISKDKILLVEDRWIYTVSCFKDKIVTGGDGNKLNIYLGFKKNILHVEDEFVHSIDIFDDKIISVGAKGVIYFN